MTVRGEQDCAHFTDGRMEAHHPAVECDSRTLKRASSPPFSSSMGVSGEIRVQKRHEGEVVSVRCLFFMQLTAGAEARTI